MSIRHRAALAAALVACGSLLPRAIHAESQSPSQATDPVIPVGSLTAFPTVVQTGTKPTLTWNISYPSLIQDFVVVTAPATVTPKETLFVDVRVLGAGVTVATAGSSNYSFVPTQAQISYDGGAYSEIFYGTNQQVSPGKIVYTRQVTAGKPLRFGGRYSYHGSWGPYFHSQSGGQNVRTLVNGEVPPTTFPLHTAPTLESFLKPYLDGQGKVKIGPMDVIVFMELTHSDSQAADQGYDLQDLVLLVTFRKP